MVERFKPNDASHKEIKRKQVNKIYNMRHEKVVAFCDTKEFYSEAIDLIRSDKPQNSKARIARDKEPLKGIPQGSPISATLANIYMLDFDERVHAAAIDSSKNAYYQRYSDDLIIVCNQDDEDYFYDLIQEEIEIKGKLEIQPQKTNVFRYELNDSHNFTGGIYENGQVNSNKQLEYLGFIYDGQSLLVKSAGFSKFYRNMKRSFRRGAHFAKKAHIPSNSLFETRLYKRYTHLGSKRRLLWLPDSSSVTGYKRTTLYDWGNFISYLNKANMVMKPINKEDSISRQYRKVWGNFHKEKNKTYRRIKEKRR
jgi:hypothetical protein